MGRLGATGSTEESADPEKAQEASLCGAPGPVCKWEAPSSLFLRALSFSLGAARSGSQDTPKPASPPGLPSLSVQLF